MAFSCERDAPVVRAMQVDGALSPAGLPLLLLYSRTGPRRALSLKLSDTRVYEPEKRTRLGRNRELCTLLRARQGYLAHFGGTLAGAGGGGGALFLAVCRGKVQLSTLNLKPLMSIANSL